MDPPFDEQYPTLKGVLKKSLEKDPSRRYSSAGAMADDLEQLISELAPAVQEPVAADREPAFSEEDRTPVFFKQIQGCGNHSASSAVFRGRFSRSGARGAVQEALKLYPANAESRNLR